VPAISPKSRLKIAPVENLSTRLDVHNTKTERLEPPKEARKQAIGSTTASADARAAILAKNKRHETRLVGHTVRDWPSLTVHGAAAALNRLHLLVLAMLGTFPRGMQTWRGIKEEKERWQIRHGLGVPRPLC
jgi:hypothetical protein